MHNASWFQNPTCAHNQSNAHVGHRHAPQVISVEVQLHLSGTAAVAGLAPRLKILDGNRLVVNDVATGPLKVWNDDHPEAPLRRNDRIVEVNGVRGTPEQLRDMCIGTEPLLLKVEKDKEYA